MILLICGVVSSVWYVVTDVIGTLRYPGYSYPNQWFSELTAQGAPTRPLMIALNEIPYNLLVLAFAAGVWESVGRTRAGRITAAGLAGFAAYYSYATIVTLVVFGVLSGQKGGRVEANLPTPWLGLEQRINAYAFMLWVAVLAIGLLRAQKAR